MKTRKAAPGDVYKRIVRAKCYIDNHYMHDLDLARVADQACFSPYHFLRLFKNMYGKTPHRYLSSKRMEQARNLLAESRMSIEEICNEVGYESPATFSLLFTRSAGVSPLAYRHRRQNQQARLSEVPARAIPHCFLEKFKLLNNQE